jgi:drug/metabolite transporter (DMT)-like permease
MTDNRLMYGAAMIIAAEFMFALMGATIRHLSADLDNAVIVFARNLVGLAILLGISAGSGLGDLATRVPALHLLRGIAGTAAMYCFFYAIANMPLADAMLLKLTAPLFMPLVALLWLKEGFTWHVLAALGVGFAGVGLILSPDLGQLQPVALIALLGGVLAAIAKVTVRRLSASEPTTRIVFYFAAIGTAISLVPLAWWGQSPAASHLAWFILLGICATGGQFLLTRGMASAPAARLAPFTFFSVVFGAALGWLFWDELLRWTTLAGALLVLVAALVVGRGRAGAGQGSRRVADAPTLS